MCFSMEKIMSRYTKKQQVSPETQQESIKAAKATQRPGQTKEQTKLIAQGIQKGIEQYKKQQKERSRELNKKLKKVSGQLSEKDEQTEINNEQVSPQFIYRQHWLPWVLLLVSWAGFGFYIFA